MIDTITKLDIGEKYMLVQEDYRKEATYIGEKDNHHSFVFVGRKYPLIYTIMISEDNISVEGNEISSKRSNGFHTFTSTELLRKKSTTKEPLAEIISKIISQE